MARNSKWRNLLSLHLSIIQESRDRSSIELTVDEIDTQNDVKDIVIAAADQGPMEASEVHESDI